MTPKLSPFIRELPTYAFDTMRHLAENYRRTRGEVIDLSMGNPDIKVPIIAHDTLRSEIGTPKSDGYSVSIGIKRLRVSAKNYYERRFGVTLDADNEIIVTLGSKEGFMSLARAITTPETVAVVPSPTYPMHKSAFTMNGGGVYDLPPKPDHGFLIELDKALDILGSNVNAIVTCFPANPTTEVASLDFYNELIRIAKRYQVPILSDLAYAELYYGDKAPPSILEAKGARDIAIEFTTMSKTYSMAGWRIGFAAGNQELVAALRHIKSYLDYGTFAPVQSAAASVLDVSDHYIEMIRKSYKARRDTLVRSFAHAGWQVPSPPASMFAWSPLPEKFQDLDSFAFARLLLEETGVWVMPGSAFGPDGFKHVRIALVQPAGKIQEASDRVKKLINGS